MYMETKDYLVIKDIDVKTLSFTIDYYNYEKRKEYGGNRGVHKIIRIPLRPNSLRSV